MFSGFSLFFLLILAEQIRNTYMIPLRWFINGNFVVVPTFLIVHRNIAITESQKHLEETKPNLKKSFFTFSLTFPSLLHFCCYLLELSCRRSFSVKRSVFGFVLWQHRCYSSVLFAKNIKHIAKIIITFFGTKTFSTKTTDKPNKISAAKYRHTCIHFIKHTYTHTHTSVLNKYYGKLATPKRHYSCCVCHLLFFIDAVFDVRRYPLVVEKNVNGQ